MATESVSEMKSTTQPTRGEPLMNQELTNQGRIEKHGGDSITSFKELQSISAGKSPKEIIDKLKSNKSSKKGKAGFREQLQQQQRAKKAAAKEEQDGKEKEEEKGSQEVSSKEGSSQEETSSQETSGIESKEEGVQKESGSSEASKEEVDKLGSERKLLKLKAGEDAYTVPSDALIDVKVNGKVEQTPLSELVDNYSGRTHLHQTAKVLKEDRQTFDRDRGDLQTALTTAHDLLVNKADLKGFAMYCAELMQADPLKVWRDLKGNPKVGEAFGVGGAELSDEQRQALEVQDELDFYKRKEESAKQRSAKLKDKEALESQVVKVQEAHKLNHDQYQALRDELAATGKFNEQDLTPDLIGKYAARRNAVTLANQALKETSIDRTQIESASKELESVILQNPGLTQEDVTTIALEVFGAQRAKRLSDKVKKLGRTTESKEKIKPQSGPFNFDELRLRQFGRR